jgi:HSP20 family protein
MNTYLVRRNLRPFNPAFAMSKAMDSLVRDAFGGFPTTWASNIPALDIVETDSAYTIKAALPGWAPEQVDVSFEDGVVTLKGEVNTESDTSETEQAKVHVREFRKESFARRFSLPVEVDADKAVAEFANGVLTLSIPKAESVKPKQIKIAVK